jgi:transcriptional regulator with PAS, ATPase and Fis domain
MPAIKLSDEAIVFLQKYRWSGNIRQLRNVAEQISVLETNRDITLETLRSYLPLENTNLPSVIGTKKSESDFATERDILYKVLFDMKSDLNDLKKLTLELMKNGTKSQDVNPNLIQKLFGTNEKDSEITIEKEPILNAVPVQSQPQHSQFEDDDDDDDQNYLFAETVEEEEVLKLEQKEIELIKKALERNKGKRKAAADELGISERTLYRKIKQFDL